MQTFIEKINYIEEVYGVDIIHASELGKAVKYNEDSKELGIRFLYVQRDTLKYLSVVPPQEIIRIVEYPYEICGIDIRLALRLILESNIEIEEILESRYHYVLDEILYRSLKTLIREIYDPYRVIEQYLEIADDLRGEEESEIDIESYLEIVRSIGRAYLISNNLSRYVEYPVTLVGIIEEIGLDEIGEREIMKLMCMKRKSREEKKVKIESIDRICNKLVEIIWYRLEEYVEESRAAFKQIAEAKVDDLFKRITGLIIITGDPNEPYV